MRACDDTHSWFNSELIRPNAAGPHQWTVAWAIEGRIDLRADTNPAAPLFELLAIGEEGGLGRGATLRHALS